MKRQGEYVGAVYGTIIPAEIEDYIRGEFARTPSLPVDDGRHGCNAKFDVEKFSVLDRRKIRRRKISCIIR